MKQSQQNHKIKFQETTITAALAAPADQALETSASFGRSEIENLNYTQLDTLITDGLTVLHKTQCELLPYLQRMHNLLARQGKRTDLQEKAGVPADMTWQKWVISKKQYIGSLATVKALLAVQKDPVIAVGTKVHEIDTDAPRCGTVIELDTASGGIALQPEGESRPVESGVKKVKVAFDGEETPETVPVNKIIIEKKSRVISIAVGALVFFEDLQAEYSYGGDKRFHRTETPTKSQLEREKTAAKLQAKKDRKDAADAEKAKQAEKKAEAARLKAEKRADESGKPVKHSRRKKTTTPATKTVAAAADDLDQHLADADKFVRENGGRAYRKDPTPEAGKFAVMQRTDKGWVSIMIDNEAAVDNRLAELLTEMVTA